MLAQPDEKTMRSARGVFGTQPAQLAVLHTGQQFVPLAAVGLVLPHPLADVSAPIPSSSAESVPIQLHSTDVEVRVELCSVVRSSIPSWPQSGSSPLRVVW
jgi:hypothetical protein